MSQRPMFTEAPEPAKPYQPLIVGPSTELGCATCDKPTAQIELSPGKTQCATCGAVWMWA